METEGRSSFSHHLLQEGSVLILVSLIIIPHMRAIEAMVGIIALNTKRLVFRICQSPHSHSIYPN